MNKKVSSYIFGALLIVFGLIFILSPESAFETIVLIAGISLIVYGGLKILLALKSDNPYASYTVAGSIFSIIFGIILIGNQNAAIKVIPILLGIWLLISGITTLLFLLKTNSDTCKWTTINAMANPVVTYTARSNGTYYVFAQDVAGNVSDSLSFEITNIG